MGVEDVRRMIQFILERYDYFVQLPQNRFVFYMEGHPNLYQRYKQDMSRLFYFLLPYSVAYPLLQLGKVFFIFVRIQNESFFNNFPRHQYLLASITFKHSRQFYDTRLFRQDII